MKKAEKDDDIESMDAQKAIEEKLYKPSGPDGKGWGDFRIIDEVD